MSLFILVNTTPTVVLTKINSDTESALVGFLKKKKLLGLLKHIGIHKIRKLFPI
jgi:thioredoxin-related protein